MKRLQNELTDFVNRSVDRHVRIAVTGLSRSGKTAFITSLVNQLLHVQSGARLPLFSSARDGRIFGVKRIPQRDLGVSRFAYDEAMSQLYSSPPQWPIPTRGVSEICLKLRYRSEASLFRHFVDNSSLYLEIVDYPGEWLLDLPMLDQDYLTWSSQMKTLLTGDRLALAQEWLALCEQCDPLAKADEDLLARIAQAYTRYLWASKEKGQHFIQPGRFVLPGELEGAPVLQFFPWVNKENVNESALSQAAKDTNMGMLKQRYHYYCEHVVKGFYRDHFQRFDRQIVLVDCLQPLNNGSDAFNDMRLALTQLMRSFQYGKRTLLRRLFSPCIDKLLFAASKADHVTPDQHENLVSLLQHVIQDAWQNAAFEGISMDCVGLASVQATQSGFVDYQGKKMPALQGDRLADGQSLTFYPGDVPSRLPNGEFWQKQAFHFDDFRPRELANDQPLPHIRLDSVLEFLLGDKLK